MIAQGDRRRPSSGWLAVTLFAACMPAMAPAAGQTPSATAQAHPAASAHANAVNGETDAARLEACMQAAGTLIDDLEKGDDKAATSDFDAGMRANLDATRLAEVWQQVGHRMGTLQGRGAPQNMMYRGHALVALPLHFDKGDVTAQVACDADGKIAGLFLRPANASPRSGNP